MGKVAFKNGIIKRKKLDLVIFIPLIIKDISILC